MVVFASLHRWTRGSPLPILGLRIEANPDGDRVVWYQLVPSFGVRRFKLPIVEGDFIGRTTFGTILVLDPHTARDCLQAEFDRTQLDRLTVRIMRHLAQMNLEREQRWDGIITGLEAELVSSRCVTA